MKCRFSWNGYDIEIQEDGNVIVKTEYREYRGRISRMTKNFVKIEAESGHLRIVLTIPKKAIPGRFQKWASSHT